MGEEAPGEDSSYFDSLRGLGESVVGVFSSDEEGPDYEGMSEKLAEDLKREDAKVPEEFLKKLASSPSPEDNKLWARLLETTAADENLTPKELELLDQRLLDEKNKFDMKEMIAGRDGKGPNFLKDIDFKNSEDIVYFADGKDVWMEVPCLSGGPIKVVSVDGGKKWKIDGLIYEYTDFKDAASDAMLIQTSLARFKLFSPDRDFFGDDNENPFRVDALGHIEFDANWLPLDARNFSALVKTGNHDEFTNEVYRRFKKMKGIDGRGEEEDGDDKDKKEKFEFNTGEPIEVTVSYKVHKEINDPHFGVAIFRKDYIYCYGPNTRFDELPIDKLLPGESKLSIYYPGPSLLPDVYFISAAIWEKEESFAYDHHCAFYKMLIKGEPCKGLFYQPYRKSLEIVSMSFKEVLCDVKIRLCNSEGKRGGIFKTEEFLNVIADINCGKKASVLSLEIYRDDDVLCFTLCAQL